MAKAEVTEEMFLAALMEVAVVAAAKAEASRAGKARAPKEEDEVGAVAPARKAEPLAEVRVLGGRGARRKPGSGWSRPPQLPQPSRRSKIGLPWQQTSIPSCRFLSCPNLEGGAVLAVIDCVIVAVASLKCGDAPMAFSRH